MIDKAITCVVIDLWIEILPSLVQFACPKVTVPMFPSTDVAPYITAHATVVSDRALSSKMILTNGIGQDGVSLVVMSKVWSTCASGVMNRPNQNAYHHASAT